MARLLTERVEIRMTDGDYTALARIADREDRTIAFVIRRAIRELLAKEGQR
jgi:predicted transcriptional regulator